MNDEQTDVNHESYTFTLDERVPEQDKLLKLARQLEDANQRSVEAASATIESVTPGRWFDVGAYNIANALVEGSLSGVLDEGVDYDMDLSNGRIFVRPGGHVASGENLLLTFDQPGIGFERHQSQQSPLFYCDVVLEEYNQYHSMWLRRRSFTAYLNVTEFPSHAGEFASYKVKATPAGPVTVLKRPEALTLPDHPVTIEPAGDSSSSSSSSSTYSSSSRSSKSSKSSASSASSYSSSSSDPDPSSGSSPSSSYSSLSTSSSSLEPGTFSSSSSSSTARSYTSSSSSYSTDSSSSSSSPNISSIDSTGVL